LAGGDDDALLVAVSARLLVGQLLPGEATREVARQPWHPWLGSPWMLRAVKSFPVAEADAVSIDHPLPRSAEEGWAGGGAQRVPVDPAALAPHVHDPIRAFSQALLRRPVFYHSNGVLTGLGEGRAEGSE